LLGSGGDALALAPRVSQRAIGFAGPVSEPGLGSGGRLRMDATLLD
jgi:hypothetical protein